jgi:NADPH:quinone reductase-like Zn-dependent oxidoreductase
MSNPRTTQAYRLSSFDKSLEGLVLDDKVALPDAEQLAPTAVLVEVHAVSLNARDYQIASATYPAPTTPPAGLIPVSDGAGKVLAVGSAVSTVKTGDRVVTHLSSDWRHGEIGNEMQASALGGGRDGVLAKHVVLDQFNLLPIPAHMNYRQAASLPVAGLTAYHCLLGFPKTVQQGQTVLIEGTGGVSIAALQIALAAGARPIVISSSDDKLKLCQNLGVHKDDCINYSNDKNWWQTVRARTPRGEGVDHTVEIAGGSTLNRALMATKAYGSVWVVVSPRPSSSPVAIATSTNSALSRVQGYMDDYKSTKDSGDGLPDTAKAILYSQAQVQGVMCGR